MDNNLNKITVVLADDHTILRRGLRSLIDNEMSIEVVGDTENGREALKLIEKLKPDIAIIDIDMPVLNGIETTQIIKKDFPKIKVIILSMYGDEEYIRLAINAGTDGFLMKECAPSELIRAIDEVYHKGVYFSSDVSLTLVKAARELYKNDVKELTSRERIIVQLIAEGNTSKDVAKSLHISINTVQKHRENIMNKLDIHDLTKLTRYAIEKGIIGNKRRRHV